MSLQVAAQLQALLHEKAKLAIENARLAHENTSLQVEPAATIDSLPDGAVPAHRRSTMAMLHRSSWSTPTPLQYATKTSAVMRRRDGLQPLELCSPLAM